MSDTNSSFTKTRSSKTAVIDGQALTAEEVAHVHEVKEIFGKLSKALKTISLYRHNTDRYEEYLQGVQTSLADFLRRTNTLDLRVGPISYKFHGVEVFRDESREGNLCYPFYRHGIRLLMFSAGITVDELLKFILLVLNEADKRTQDDLITKLWKAELNHIEWVVVENWKVLEDEDEEQVKIEVDKIVKYLYRQLHSNTEDIQRFARVSVDDLDLQLDNVDTTRKLVIEGVTATSADKTRIQRSMEEEDSQRLLPKMVIILFQLLELDTTAETFEDVAEGFIQLLDAMLLAGDFGSIHQVRDRFHSRLQKNLKPEVKEMVQGVAQRFIERMADPQRLALISQMLNGGKVNDGDGLRAYLSSLPEASTSQIANMLESIEIPTNRRLVCDVLVQIGRNFPDIFASRLSHPSSNVVKDMLYIIDAIGFKDKFQMIARVLSHPNSILRLEALQTIGRNPTEECFKVVLSCVNGGDAQLRTAAFRVLPNYDANRVVEILLRICRAEDFEKRERNEQKTAFLALAQINHPQGMEFLNELFAQKGGLLGRKKVEERKILVLEALAVLPSIPVFQFLAAQAQNLQTNSKETAEKARVAALEMRERLVGGQVKR